MEEGEDPNRPEMQPAAAAGNRRRSDNRRSWEVIMKSMMSARALAVAIFAATMLAIGSAAAQTYPERPITMLVAFPPGGADDAIARIIQDPLQRALGQPIVVENVGGAGGRIAAARAARAEPDGYTIVLHQDALAAAMTLYPNRTFDAVKDFVPIGLINTAATTLAGRPDLPPNNFKELLPWTKTPGQNIKMWPSRRRLVRSSRRRADHAGARLEGHASAVSRRRSGAGRPVGRPSRSRASSRRWSPGLWSGTAR